MNTSHMSAGSCWTRRDPYHLSANDVFDQGDESVAHHVLKLDSLLNGCGGVTPVDERLLRSRGPKHADHEIIHVVGLHPSRACAVEVFVQLDQAIRMAVGVVPWLAVRGTCPVGSQRLRSGTRAKGSRSRQAQAPIVAPEPLSSQGEAFVGFSSFCLARDTNSGGRESEAACRPPKPPSPARRCLMP